jgi:ATP-dependent DNA ligase
LQLRIHPAASRVRLLSQEIPASIVFFDLLCEKDRNLTEVPFEERRQRLETICSTMTVPIHLTPATRDLAVARDWFRRFEGAGFDGVIAKEVSGIYEPNKRVMLKIKHERDCDCVVAGFRWHKNSEQSAVGSLLLGLFDDTGNLHHVGVCASFSTLVRRELVEFLSPYRKDALVEHPWKKWAEMERFAEESGQRMPGGQSRWSQGKDLSWEPVRPELVVEVAYDHMQGDRFRHTAQFRRWRKDKKPTDCTYAQLEVVPPQELSEIFKSGR